MDQQKFSGCKISYQGNILYCSRFRTREENYETAKQVLIELLGTDPFEVLDSGEIPFEILGGKVEFYRSI